MSALIGFLSGAGAAGVQMGMQHMRSLDEAERDERLAKAREEAEIQKEKRIEALRKAPYERLGKKAGEAANEDVPTVIKPVDKVSGFDPKAADVGPTQNDGFKGDIKSIRQGIADMKDPKARAEAMAQLDRQVEADNKTNAAIIGPTRKRTPDEALKTAAERSKVDDPEAAAAYEEKFGRPAREERRLDQADERERNRDRRDAERGDREEKRIAAYDKKIDNDAAYQRRREERMDRFAEIQEARLAAQGDKAEIQSQRAALSTLTTNTERELERVMVLAKDPLLDKQMKEMFEGRTASLTRDLTRYRKGLEAMAGYAVPKAEPEKPRARNGWDSTTGEVFKDGKVIGKADSEKAARAVFGGADTPKATNDATTPKNAGPSKPLIGEVDKGPASGATSAGDLYRAVDRDAIDKKKADAAQDKARREAAADKDKELKGLMDDYNATKGSDPLYANKVLNKMTALRKERYGL